MASEERESAGSSAASLTQFRHARFEKASLYLISVRLIGR